MSEQASDLLIVAAIPRETAGIRRRMEEPETRSVAGVVWTLGRWCNTRVWVAHSGIGEQAAVAFSGKLAESGLRFTRAVLIGVAGGLDPALGAGALIGVHQIIAPSVDGSSGERLMVDRPEPPSAPAGVSVTVEELLDAEEKADRFLDLGRPSGAVAELEAAFLWPSLRSVAGHVSSFRVVSDTAAETLPACVRWVDSRGRLGWGGGLRTVGLCLRRPTTVMALVRLQRRMRRAQATLADVVEMALAAAPGSARSNASGS